MQTPSGLKWISNGFCVQKRMHPGGKQGLSTKLMKLPTPPAFCCLSSCSQNPLAGNSHPLDGFYPHFWRYQFIPTRTMENPLHSPLENPSNLLVRWIERETVRPKLGTGECVLLEVCSKRIFLDGTPEWQPGEMFGEEYFWRDSWIIFLKKWY